MTPEELMRRVFAQLDREYRKAGRSSRDVCRSLGRAADYLHKRRQVQRIGLYQLSQVLEELGLAPETFFQAALSTPPEPPHPTADRPTASTTKGSQSPSESGTRASAAEGALERFGQRAFKQEQGVGASLPARPPRMPTTLVSTSPPTIEELQYLDSLDRLRPTYPRESVAEAERLCRTAHEAGRAHLQSLAAAVWASGLRSLCLVDPAAVILWRSAIQVCLRLEGQPGLPGHLLRAAKIVSDPGDHVLAEQLADQALILSYNLHDPLTAAKAAIDKAVFLGRQGRYHPAVHLLNSLVENHLPSLESAESGGSGDSNILFCAAFHTLALTFFALDSLPDAISASNQALAHAHDKDSCARATWLQARILEAQRQYPAALHCFDKALKLIEYHPVNQALILAESVRACLHMQKPDAAMQRAKEAIPLVFALQKGNRHCAEALRDLVFTLAFNNPDSLPRDRQVSQWLKLVNSSIDRITGGPA